MKFDILTINPERFPNYFNSSILKRAINNNIIECNTIDFREYSGNKHNTVDDYSYSGGAGMLIRVDPIHRALTHIKDYEKAYVILTSPSGNQFNQKKALELSKKEHLIIICGHYEGVDARVLNYVDEEISIGDYVLTGGEVPALVIVDSVSRLIPGVISEDSISTESFNDDLLEYPQYTRPQEYDGHSVPEILLSGHHAKIKKWQRYEALKKTLLVRPDLLEKATLTPEDLAMIEEIKNEICKED